MKVYLDDERATPEGWVRCYWPDEVIEHLHSGKVTEVSLDHDLGDDARGTGYEVLLWIEQAVAGRGWTPPILSVHSANTSARQKMEAAIVQIGKLEDAQNNYARHSQKGNFLTDPFSEKPIWFVPPSGEPILLEDSAHISTFFELNDGTALGADHHWQCFRQEFLDAGLRRPLVRAPMAIWDLETGRRLYFLNGHHLGAVCGAELLDDTRLLTWGRDYLIRIWHRETFECLEVLPLPLFADPVKQEAILSTREFSKLSRPEKKRYIFERHLPAPDVRIDWIVAPGLPQHHYECLTGTHKDQSIVNRWLPSVDRQGDHGAHRILDVEGAEAGYSTWKLLTDGRLVGGGTTYGTSGYIYVWDGLYDLRILQPARASINMELSGEVLPNVIEMKELTGMDAEDVYRFKL
tara:strand:+ start:406 stop:1623 length:1218 start_codon:yes stop_codon:yes gene_type:complete